MFNLLNLSYWFNILMKLITLQDDKDESIFTFINPFDLVNILVQVFTSLCYVLESIVWSWAVMLTCSYIYVHNYFARESTSCATNFTIFKHWVESWNFYPLDSFLGYWLQFSFSSLDIQLDFTSFPNLFYDPFCHVWLVSKAWPS